jgi:FkbM family methyltransferase
MPTVRQSVVAFVTRRYPLYSGCGTLANHRVVQRLAGPGNDLGWGRVRGGARVSAPLGDYVGRAVYYVGDLDRKITWLCSRLVRRGDTVIDVGANLGLVTMVLSSMVGPTGIVHAFEPIPQMQELIDRSLARNQTTNVRLHRCALGSAPDLLTLSVPKGHAGSASFVAERQHADSDRVEVPVRTLSEVLAEEAVGHVRLVKIDVEGFEPEVLAGAETHFAQYPPDAILFELNDLAADVASHPTIGLLDKLGYGFFSIPKTLFRVRVARFDAANPSPGSGHDFLAVRRDRYEEVARLLRATG